MAVILIENIKRYIGVHADTKPTSSVPVGSTFFETDTKNIYVFDGTNWGVGNPTFQTGDTITISSIEGKDAEAAAVTGKPLTVGYKDASGKATGVTPVNRLPVVAELSGSKMELYGVAIEDRPDANTVAVGATFTIVDDTGNFDSYISNGTDWLEV